jgi:predicted RNase H-like HicB family nuclease
MNLRDAGEWRLLPTGAANLIASGLIPFPLSKGVRSYRNADPLRLSQRYPVRAREPDKGDGSMVSAMPEIGGFETRVFRSDEGGGYIAVAPDLPGCSAFGKTWPEAITELQGAMTAWIIAARTAENATVSASH